MDLAAFAEVLWRQRVVVLAVLGIGALLFGFAISRPKKYVATATFLAVPVGSTTAPLDPNGDPDQATITPSDLPGLLGATGLLSRVRADLGLSRKQLEDVAANVKAKISPTSDVIPLTVTDTDPKRAVHEANAFVRELQRFERQVAMSRYDLLIADIKSQLASRAADLRDIDGRINGISTGDAYASAENGTSAINAQLVQLQAKRDELTTALQADTASAAMIDERPGMTTSLAREQIIGNDPVFSNLRGQYGKDLAALHNEQAGYTAAFPGLKGLAEQVQRESDALSSEESAAASNPGRSPAYVSALLDANKADAAVAADRAQLSALDAQIDAAQRHLSASGVEAVSLASLRRDRDAGTTAYEQLSARLARATADRSQAASINSIVILNDAEGASLTLLSRPSVLAIAFGFVFLWLAVTAAILVDASDRRLTRARIEALYGAPVSGTVG